jgi:hypothetical protein
MEISNPDFGANYVSVNFISSCHFFSTLNQTEQIELQITHIIIWIWVLLKIIIYIYIYIYILQSFWRSNELSLLKNLKEEEVHLHHRVSLAESSLGGFPSIHFLNVTAFQRLLWCMWIWQDCTRSWFFGPDWWVISDQMVLPSFGL